MTLWSPIVLMLPTQPWKHGQPSGFWDVLVLGTGPFSAYTGTANPAVIHVLGAFLAHRQSWYPKKGESCWDGLTPRLCPGQPGVPTAGDSCPFIYSARLSPCVSQFRYSYFSLCYGLNESPKAQVLATSSSMQQC